MAIWVTYADRIKGYGSQSIRDRFADLLTDGVRNKAGGDLSVNIGSGLSVNVATGVAFVGGYRIYVDAVANLVLAAADVTNPRIDLVEIGVAANSLTNSNTNPGGQVQTTSLVVKIVAGTPGPSPVAPAADTGFIALAQVRVNAGSSTPASVVDARAQATLGGSVNPLSTQIGQGGGNASVTAAGEVDLSPASGQVVKLLGNMVPDANGTRNSGSLTLNWANVYTQALVLPARTVTDLVTGFSLSGQATITGGAQVAAGTGLSGSQAGQIVTFANAGVTAVAASGFGNLVGAVALTGSGNISVSQSGQTITVSDTILTLANSWSALQTFGAGFKLAAGKPILLDGGAAIGANGTVIQSDGVKAYWGSAVPSWAVNGGAARTSPLNLKSGAAITVTDDGAGNATIAASSATTLITSQTLAAPAASITLSGIPSGFRHLLVTMTARVDVAALSTTCALRFNGDVGSNYWPAQVFNTNNTSVGFQSNSATGSMTVGSVTGSSAGANRLVHMQILVLNYAQTAYNRGCQYQTGLYDGGNYLYTAGWGEWGNIAAAINAITLFPATGNFIANTAVALYGLS